MQPMDAMAGLVSTCLLPSWPELNMSLATAVLLVLLFLLLRLALDNEQQRRSGIANDRTINKSILQPITEQETKAAAESEQFVTDASPVSASYQGRDSTGWLYHMKMELLAASNLPAANMSGTSDPYAVITCCFQKRFSSVVPGSRNPMWGEEFDFYSEELPVSVTISIWDWDIIWKSTELGTTSIQVADEGMGAVEWIPLENVAGQVCVQFSCQRIQRKADGNVNGGAGPGLSNAKLRRLSVVQQYEQVATEVRQKPGPLQTIFNLPPDEVVLHNYSCALERSFLYHGRMYVSLYHICFHSNVFSKNITLTLPLEDIEEMRKSQHAFINPSITIILKAGSGGHGVPPLSSPDGRPKYKFASFWNRSRVLRALLYTQQQFFEIEAATEQEEESQIIRTRSKRWESTIQTEEKETAIVENQVEVLPDLEPFLQEDVLSPILQDELPGTAQECFEILFSESSHFTEHYRGVREDKELQIESWENSEEYGGLLRKVTFRSLCNSPMCPPTTKMTDWQHSFFRSSNQIMVLEVIQQAHDVPFGSTFEIQARWTVSTESETKSKVEVVMGVHFKKWLVMQGKIRGGATNEYKADAAMLLNLAKKQILEAKKNGQINPMDQNGAMGLLEVPGNRVELNPPPLPSSET